jgi:hypothetical protein
MNLVFHSFSFDNSEILRFLYFGANDMAVIGLFILLLSSYRGKIRRLLIVGLIYAIFKLIADILMLCGIGAHDYWLYTAISMLIIGIGLLWAKCTL